LGKRSMVVQTRPVRNNLVIDIQGQVDLHTSPRMRSAILEGINRKEVSQVAVNLGEVSYIDSSGVATLVEGLQLARTRNCRFVLFGLRQETKEVLELARLDRIFEIRATEVDALSE
jgi:anti-sigma B factor antagonist